MYHTETARRAILRRLGAGLLAAVMLLFTVSTTMPLPAEAVTQQQINDLKSKASDLSSQKAELQKKLDKLAGSKSDAISQKMLLEQKINVLQDEINVSQQTIENLGVMIAQKQQELEEAIEKEEQYYDLFCERVRNMEEEGSVSYWAILFNASSFSDLLDRVAIISDLAEYDNGVMEAMAVARQAVADAKAELEQSKAEEESAKATLESQQAELRSEEAKVDNLISQINSESAAYASQMEDLEENADAIAAEIAKAEKQYAAQIEAQRRAEEEARRQQAANSGSGGSSGGGGGTIVGKGAYIWPLSGYTRVVSGFVYRNCPYHGRELHRGLDIPAPTGTPIHAAASGVVVISTYGSSYGNYVVIAHANGGRTLYAHQSQRAVSAGTTVSQGQVIGYVGCTGNSTAPHLHWETWTGSSSSSLVNPMNYF